MKYSILGFNQEMVCEIRKTILNKNKYKILTLDVSDLLIIQEIADFMNRKKVIKYTIDDKTYVSIKYDLILEDLPILGIKKQALRDKIDKICELGIIEKKVIVNESGSWTAFRLSDKYEELRYNVDGGVCSQLHRGVYSTTQGCVADYTPKTNNTITNITNNKEKDINISSKKDELFEECWKAYNRKGSKKQSKAQWAKLSDDEKQSIMPHIKSYTSSREINYQKDFERYLRDKIFNEVIYDKSGQVVFDPQKCITSDYMPQQSPMLNWNEYYNCYMYVGYWDGHIPDGYSDDDRPDGASVTLNNGRGTIVWDRETKQWIKK